MTTIYDKYEVKRIKNSYQEKSNEQTEIEKLKELDRKVKNPPKIFAYTFGTLSTLVLGTGMSLAMEVIGNIMPLGIAVGVAGIVLMSITYPIYKKLLQKRKNKYKNIILEKSNQILNEEAE